MPCYSGANYGQEDRNVKYVDRDNPKDKEAIKQLKDHISKLEAGLCAILTELERKDLIQEIVPEASRKGLINIIDFWDSHKKEDVTRLARDLHSRYSVHEQEMLRSLLNKSKI